MSHRKRRADSVAPQATSPDTSAPVAKPPRRNKLALVAGSLLLAAWIVFLVVLAVIG